MYTHRNNNRNTIIENEDWAQQTRLYPHIYPDELEYREREIEREIQGREEWGVESHYPTIPYPAPQSPTVQKEREEREEINLKAPEPWMPPPAKWYQRQSFLRPLGKIMTVAGFVSFAPHFRYALSSMVYSPRVLRTIPKPKVSPPVLIAGILSVALGIYLTKKKYLRDPKAIAQYRKHIFSADTKFQTIVDEYGWNVLFVIATKEELCFKLYQEMQNVRGLYQICSIYKVNNLRAYLQNDVMRAIDVEARWEYDVTRAAEGTGPELGVVVQECGEFLLTASHMKVEKIRESLECDPTMTGYSFVDLFTKFEASIRRIFKKGFLSARFIREKLLNQLHHDPTLKFSFIAKHRWLVGSVVSPQEMAPLFRTARENCSCIVTFLETYMTWPIDTYQKEIIPDEYDYSKLKQIYDEFIAYKTSIQKDIAHINKRYEEGIEEARNTRERKMKQLNQSTNTQLSNLQQTKDGLAMGAVNEIYRNERTEQIKEDEIEQEKKLKQTKRDDTRKAEKQIEGKRIELHKDYQTFLSLRKYPQPLLYTAPPPFYPQSPVHVHPSAPPMPQL